METGNHSRSPIVVAIAEAEQKTSGQISVHLSRRWIDRDPLKSANQIFVRYRLHQTEQRNAVLLYFNLRRKKFAICGDVGIHQRVGNEYWQGVARELKSELQGTHYERAIANSIRKIGTVMAKFFPREGLQKKVNELPDDVTED